MHIVAPTAKSGISAIRVLLGIGIETGQITATKIAMEKEHGIQGKTGHSNGRWTDRDHH